MKTFIKYFLIALLSQPIGLFILAIFGSKFVWEIFYDPIFKFIANRLRHNEIEIGFAVIPIFLMVLIVFSAYAVLITGLVILVKKGKMD